MVISSRSWPTAASTLSSGRRSSSYSHQSTGSPGSPGSPGTATNLPPTKEISFTGAWRMRGPTSWYFDGSRSDHTVGGSTTWSSTEMILGSCMARSYPRADGVSGPMKRKVGALVTRTLLQTIISITRWGKVRSAGVRVQTDGKQFALDGKRFLFRGVTYGTFGQREDGALFPDREQVKQDFCAMHEAGFTVVRTYTPPPDDVVELAADWGLKLFAGVFWSDWRYLLGASRRQHRDIVRRAETEVRAVARRLAGTEAVMALSLGDEVPADLLRWVGTRRVASTLDELVDTVRAEDPDQLVSYANYPTTEYLPLDSFDFLTFNVFLERQVDFRRYLTRLQHLAGDRPLVLGEVGLHAGDGPGGERRQASALDWQLRTALDRGVAGACVFAWTDEWSVGDQPVTGWRFGLTREDRSPRPAMEVARSWNDRTVA